MRILFATDGSDDAKAALEWLRYLPLPADREVMALTVVPLPGLRVVPEMADEFRHAVVAEARRLADDTASELLTGRTAIGRVVEGDPREEIVAAARAWGADLIVLGARGLGAIREFLLGSVSRAVARHAPCPVLVCKGPPRAVATITVGVDGSPHARRALEWLAGLPLAPNVRVRLVGVAEPQHYPASAPTIVREDLRTAVAAVEAERRSVLERAVTDVAAVLRGRAHVASEVMTGMPAAVLVDETERTGGDLIVVGPRGAGGLTRLVLGSVSETVLRHAACPVLIVRPRETS